MEKISLIRVQIGLWPLSWNRITFMNHRQHCIPKQFPLYHGLVIKPFKHAHGDISAKTTLLIGMRATERKQRKRRKRRLARCKRLRRKWGELGRSLCTQRLTKPRYSSVLRNQSDNEMLRYIYNNVRIQAVAKPNHINQGGMQSSIT